jgi:cell wall-associated NlpC family hydrolase
MIRLLTKVVFLGALALGGIVAAGAPAGADSPAAQRAATYAAAQVGKPYVFGASGPNAFDNPGLTKAAYASAGIVLPHNTAQQYAASTPVARADLRVGDLVFYGSGTPTSVAISVGGNRVILAGHAGGVVHYADIDQATVFAIGRIA